MCRAASPESRQTCIKYRVANDEMTVLVVLVPASAPMSHHSFRFLLPYYVGNSQRTFLIERDFSIGVLKKNRLSSEQMSFLLRGRTLHITVLPNAHVVRSAPFARGQAKQNARSTSLDLLAQGG